jgi:hypothetical protein
MKRCRENHNEADLVLHSLVQRSADLFLRLTSALTNTGAGAMSLSYGLKLLYFDASTSIEMQDSPSLDNRYSLCKFAAYFVPPKPLRHNMLC